MGVESRNPPPFFWTQWNRQTVFTKMTDEDSSLRGLFSNDKKGNLSAQAGSRPLMMVNGEWSSTPACHWLSWFNHRPLTTKRHYSCSRIRIKQRLHSHFIARTTAHVGWSKNLHQLPIHYQKSCTAINHDPLAGAEKLPTITTYHQETKDMENIERFKDIVVTTAVITVAFFERGRITDSSSSLISSSFVASCYVAAFLFVSSKYATLNYNDLFAFEQITLVCDVKHLSSLDVVSSVPIVEALRNSSAWWGEISKE